MEEIGKSNIKSLQQLETRTGRELVNRTTRVVSDIDIVFKGNKMIAKHEQLVHGTNPSAPEVIVH